MAVKAFRLDVVPEVSARLADALRRLAASPVDHPAIVPVIGAGLEGTTAFLACEYVAAETLDVSLRQLAPAPIETVLPLLRQLAEGLEAAWASGLGHGALHPRDIFVTPGTPDASVGPRGVRVTGVGVAAALEALRIPAPVRRPYTAPERERGGPWDIRADVYSLGVITHELLTGRRPAGPIEQEADQDAPQAELQAGIPAAQQVAIRRALSGALASEPARRYDSPMAFVDALTTGALPTASNDAPVVAKAAAPEREWPSDLAAEIGPGIDTEPDLRPEAPPDTVHPDARQLADELRSGAQTGLGNHQRFEPRYLGGIRDSPYLTVPEETEHGPGRGALAVVLVLVLAVGTGFGYWLRGPSPAVPAGQAPVPEAEPQVTEEPFGTEVPVTQAAEPQSAPATAAPATAGPSPAASAVPEAAPERGRLLVRSVPDGAKVSINGRERGTTPAAIRDLPFGTYTVAVSRPGYQRREQKLTVSATVPAREITIELPKVASAATVAGSRAAAQAVTTGAVYVETRPAGAKVTIDGRAAGTSPMRVPELVPGSHTIRVDLAGHKSVTTTVVVRAGQQTTVRLSLEIQ